jgi:hypothetical protein
MGSFLKTAYIRINVAPNKLIIQNPDGSSEVLILSEKIH